MKSLSITCKSGFCPGRDLLPVQQAPGALQIGTTGKAPETPTGRPQDALTLLHNSLTSSQIDAFESVIVDVLGENQPALDIPAEERFMALAQGRHLKHSDS